MQNSQLLVPSIKRLSWVKFMSTLEKLDGVFGFPNRTLYICLLDYCGTHHICIVYISLLLRHSVPPSGGIFMLEPPEVGKERRNLEISPKYKLPARIINTYRTATFEGGLSFPTRDVRETATRLLGVLRAHHYWKYHGLGYNSTL